MWLALVGKLEPAMIGGRPQCMYLHGWLFNSFREPVVGLDQMRKLPSRDYIAVLRRGHLFRVDLTDGQGKPISFRKLQATFQSILDRVDDDSWIGVLTATLERRPACRPGVSTAARIFW
ncbi:hypothetical protein BDW75DRAFT_224088 [Aspergillus navahoensis]